MNRNRNVVERHWKLRWHDAIVDAVETLDWEIAADNCELTRGKIKERWSRLSDDQLNMISGKRYQLIDAIQESYGIGKDEAEHQVRDWEARNDEWFDEIARRGRNNAGALRH